MNNTKTIFKSLLIMIVAISLFTVSCSKDEGGTKTPTNPAQPITITGQNITDALKNIPEITIGKTKISFNGITDAENTRTITGTDGSSATDAISTKTDLETKIKEGLTISGATVSATATTYDISAKADITVTITITPASGNSFAAADSLKPYTATDGKKVEVQLTLKPEANKKWNGNGG